MPSIHPSTRFSTAGLLVLAAWLLAACGGGGPTPPDPVPGPGAPAYRVRPPAGKLPWPQHDPSWSQARYDAMLDSVWVINNFAVYQGGAERTSLYLHDGLDVVLPNGTRIHAVEAGTVRAIVDRTEFYRLLVVEDEDEPGLGWAYIHVDSFRVVVGQRVAQGTELAQVRFRGVEHLHLGRVRQAPDGGWDPQEIAYLQPDTFFVYRDTEPPVFQGGFRYVRNGTDEAFLPAAPGEPVIVSGDVDVVAGLRDPGEWARSKGPFGGPDTYGDRNAVNRIAYEIAGPGGVIVRATALDLSRVALPRSRGLAESRQALSLYQHYGSVSPAAPPVGIFNRKFHYHVVTNTDGAGRPGDLDASVDTASWRTAELGADGTRRFPDGDYTVTVRAWDFKGNAAARTETVRVRNGSASTPTSFGSRWPPAKPPPSTSTWPSFPRSGARW